MTEKQKQLLMKDLCGRLPYGVKCNIYRVDDNGIGWRKAKLDGIYQSNWGIEFDFGDSGVIIEFNKIKPYLFPLSSMSTSERNEIADILGCDFPWFISEGKLTWTVGGSVESELFELTIDQLEKLMHIFNSRHYDYRGLIEQGLATDATRLGIYKEEEELFDIIV